MKEEKINWNMSEDYCEYLVQVIKRIDVWFMQDNFEMVYKEISNIFNQLEWSIRKQIKDEDVCTGINESLNKVNDAIKNYKINETKLDSEMKRRRRIILSNKTRLAASDLYRLIMNTIDRLGLLLSKEKVDNRLSVYKQ